MLAENLVEEFELKEDEPWYDHQDLQQGEAAGGGRAAWPGGSGPRSCEKLPVARGRQVPGAGPGARAERPHLPVPPGRLCAAVGITPAVGREPAPGAAGRAFPVGPRASPGPGCCWGRGRRGGSAPAAGERGAEEGPAPSPVRARQPCGRVTS